MPCWVYSTTQTRGSSYFEAFAARFENVPFQDIMPILALLQRGKRRRGDEKGPQSEVTLTCSGK